MKKSRWILIAGMVVAASGVKADLKPISDLAMSEVTGQAFVSVDRQYHPDVDNATSYTRVNLGMDIEIQTNIDTLELGRYDRPGEKPGTSDVLINNFSLGYIESQQLYVDNPKTPRMFKPDGSAYQEGEIVPFMLDNPFFEFAYDENLQEIVGFRLGFGEAMGILSGDIESLTGNVNVVINDVGAAMADAVQDNPSVADGIIKELTVLLEKDNPMSSKAQLVKGDPNDPDVGALDPIRAEYIGIPDGEVFVLDGASGFARWAMKYFLAPGSTSEIRTPGCNSTLDCPGGSIEIVAKDCIVLAIYSCFDLGIYNSFAVGELGEINGKRAVTAPVSGAFMSFQTKPLEWLEDVKKTNPQSADFIQATTGAFFNIPNGATEVNLSEALYGVQRYRTEYIDRGKGLF